VLRRFALLIAISALALPGPAGAAYYSVTGGGAQLQIGDGEFPLPVQPATAGGAQIGTMTMFPPLLIPVNPDPAKALVKQTAGPDPKQITIPPGVFVRPAPGPKAIGVLKHNPKLLQVRTNFTFSAPAPQLGSAALRAGGRTGPPIATFKGPILGALVFYEKTTAQFGGPLQARIAPAPARVFVDRGIKLPCKHPVFGGLDVTCQAPLVAWSPGSLAAFGAPVGFSTMTSAPPPKSPNIVNASIPNTTGLIAQSASAAKIGSIVNWATSAGFPWTTGRVIVSSKEALGVYEKFTVTGMDSRMNGVGTISLVSGALSNRKLSGPNGSRGWLRLSVPEPSAARGALAALVTLSACRALARRAAD
jgi:hypothetical protein